MGWTVMYCERREVAWLMEEGLNFAGYVAGEDLRWREGILWLFAACR
jgi:hypothetical protein